MEKPEHAPFDAPLTLYETEVRPEWVDYNGHMSEAFYVLVFGYATDALLDKLGLDARYRESERASVYTVEGHVNYLQEVAERAQLTVTTQVLEANLKRARIFHFMYAKGNARPVATEELLLAHIDTAQARSSPFPSSTLGKLEAILDAHADLPLPELAGRSIALRK